MREKEGCSVPDARVMNAWCEACILLLFKVCDLARVHVEGGLSLAVVELGSPNLSLRFECI